MLSHLILAASWLYFTPTQAQYDPNAVYKTPDIYPAPNATGAGGWSEAFQKAQAVVDQLTLDEKAQIATGVTGPCVGSIEPISRVGFKGLCLQDGPLAIRVADYASVFPAGLTVAATWDRELALQRGVQLGIEFRAKGAHVGLGPVVGPLGREPLGGRNWEGFSPDPYLTGELAAKTITGMQSSGLQACVKHFIGNEQVTGQGHSVETGKVMEAYSANIDDRTMHELYLWPFANSVKAGVAAVMCSYNRINQTYGCQNSKTLNGLLKGELGFQGYVVSDWYATNAGVAGVLAGQDMDQPGNNHLDYSTTTGPSLFGSNLTLAVQNGSVPISRVDDMVTRILTPYFYLGQDADDYPLIDPSSAELGGFDASTSYTQWPIGGEKHRDVRGNHAKLIREIGAAAITLLKNSNGILPLKTPPKVIGVFGNDAADFSEGLYAPPVAYNIGTLAAGGGSGGGRFTYVVSPLDAIKQWAKQSNSLVQYITSNSVVLNDASGGFATSGILTDIYPIPDVCFVFLKYYVAEGPDHSDFDLNNNGTGFINAVASQCSNTIVVTHAGSPTSMSWADHENVTAILTRSSASRPFAGEQSGNAIIDVLSGAYNPSSKLPFTVAYNASDYNVAVTNFTALNNSQWGQELNFTEGLAIDYRHFDSAGIQPRYEFGFGLSYTTFNITSLKVTSIGSKPFPFPPATAEVVPGGNQALWDDLVSVTFTVKNTGSIDGATVPQLYLSFPESTSPADTPVQVLRGFSKIHLPAHSAKIVSFKLQRRDLSFWNVTAQDWQIPTGAFLVKLGLSSRDIQQTQTIMIL